MEFKITAKEASAIAKNIGADAEKFNAELTKIEKEIREAARNGATEVLHKYSAEFADVQLYREIMNILEEKGFIVGYLTNGSQIKHPNNVMISWIFGDICDKYNKITMREV